MLYDFHPGSAPFTDMTEEEKKEKEKEAARIAINPRGVLIALAMYDNPGSLQGKLKAIWMLAADLARKAETNHSKKLCNLWVQKYNPSLQLQLKAKQVLACAPLHSDPLAMVYIDLLATVRNIETKEKSSRAGGVKRSALSSDVDEATYINTLLLPKNISNRCFLDQVVPHFFALQLHCYRMHPMLEFPQTVPEDPIIRQARAAKGGGAKAIGEDLLKEKFSEFLESLGKRSFQSKKAFFRRLEDELAAILDDYQAHQLHKPHPKTKRKVTYGHDLVADSLERKFREWQKNDPVFEKRFLALLAKKKKAPESS